MDHRGRVILPVEFDSISLSRSDPYATVWTRGQANLFALDGRAVFPEWVEIKRLVDLR